MTKPVLPPEARQAAKSAALDLPFLGRLVIVALSLTLIVAATAAFFSPRWALDYLLVGLWMAGNAVLLGYLLWAGTSQPRRLFTLFILAPVKIVWLCLLFVFCLYFSPAPSAIVAGLTSFFVAVAGAVLQWMQKQAIAASRQSPPDGKST